MKLFTSAILIFAYVALMLRPSVPLFEYGLQKDYIASTLCENKDRPEMNCEGACYLSKQLKKAQGDAPADSEAPVIMVVPVHIISQSNIAILPSTGLPSGVIHRQLQDLWSLDPTVPPPRFQG